MKMMKVWIGDPQHALRMRVETDWNGHPLTTDAFPYMSSDIAHQAPSTKASQMVCNDIGDQHGSREVKVHEAEPQIMKTAMRASKSREYTVG